MKKITLSLVLIFAFNLGFSQTKLAKLTFETDPSDTDPAITDISYTTNLSFLATSLPVPSGEYSDGDGDYFTRTYNGDVAGSQINSTYTYTKPVDLGDYFFAAGDIDDGGLYSIPVKIDLDQIDIQYYENLEIRVYLASITGELNGGGNLRSWDNSLTNPSSGNDYVHFNSSIDSGAYNNLLWVESTASIGSLNGEPAIDHGFDGRGDAGAANAVDTTFKQFTAAISGTGSTLDIEIEFFLNNFAEDIAIDNIEIWGDLVRTPCTGSYTEWDGSAWDNGAPNIRTRVRIQAGQTYSTDINGGSFSACKIDVEGTLDITDGYYVEVENEVVIDAGATLLVQNNGAFVLNNDSGSYTNNGTCIVRKNTHSLNNWYDYTYWSSPVSGITIGTSPLADSYRRYWHNANNYLDVLAEVPGNTDTFIAGSDNIDDNGNDWQVATNTTVITPGVGYVASHNPTGFISGLSYSYDFVGDLNNGVITAPIVYDASNTGGHWNLIGNPYPSALDFDAFVTNNPGVVDGAAYLWSHATALSATTNGNEDFNFSQSDYIIINTGSGSVNNSPGSLLEYIPSGQSFFIAGLSNANVTFNNSMRIKNPDSNTQFFKNSNSKGKKTSQENKIWLNLTSDVGVFNQVLIAYVEGATDSYDGMSYDAPRNANKGVASIIYTLIDDINDKKFAIQGKGVNSLNEDEIIPLGFFTSTDSAALYELSIDHFQGDFFSEKTTFLKDKFLNKIHNLSDSNYVFTSEVGEYNNRFEIAFKSSLLSTDNIDLTGINLKIISLDNHLVNFKITTNDVTIKDIAIYDLLGRNLYNFYGHSNSETYSLNNLKNTAYIAKVKLSNDVIITKKIMKKL
ncbi:T9SS type A sorting domain-containing protein [Algibacter sp.]|uniref:T9SS type A sorting domain-containing protein n=1 Tax=Algibacter sp. TaxID=1872428 RepID=UPI003C786A20